MLPVEARVVISRRALRAAVYAVVIIPGRMARGLCGVLLVGTEQGLVLHRVPLCAVMNVGP